MIMLTPNTGKESICIAKYNVYVKVIDFNIKYVLKEIVIGPGQHTWYWVPLKEDKYIDLTGIDGNFCSFNHAINRSINDPYCTVYVFNSYEEMFREWEEIKYVDSIKTKYVSDQK